MTLMEAKKKLERYCAYQERSHVDVREKLRSLGFRNHDADEIIAHLISNDYLNESRFALAFARGKHRIKLWGRDRIRFELKAHGVSAANQREALNQFDDDEYLQQLENIAAKRWESLSEKGALKRKKCVDFLLYKGYEYELIALVMKNFV